MENTNRNAYTSSMRTLFTLLRSLFQPLPFLGLLLLFSLVEGAVMWQKITSLQHTVATLQQTTVRSVAAAPTQTPGLVKVTPVTSSDHILGSQNAAVTLIEYADTECPYCKQFHTVLQQAKQQYGDQIAWVYRPYPLSIHANAQKEALAQECVASLGGNQAFWNFTDTIFEQTTSGGTGFPEDQLAPLAAREGIDSGAFTNCLNANTYTAKITQSITQGSAAGVAGTPTTFLVTKSGAVTTLTGGLTYDQLKAKLYAALQQ